MILPILYFTSQIYTFFLNKQTQLQKNFKEFYFITIPPLKITKSEVLYPAFCHFIFTLYVKSKFFATLKLLTTLGNHIKT